MSVYNLTGRIVSTLVDGMQSAGQYEVRFDGCQPVCTCTICVQTDKLSLEPCCPMPTSIEVEIPTTLALSQNYPNPFNPSTTITYTLDRPGLVEMSVYNLTGRIVSTLVDGMQSAGQYEVRFDADGLPAGMYLYHLRADGQTITRAMTLR